MPKEISYTVADRFRYGKKFSSGNSKVTVDGDTVRMYLFGNLIAEKNMKTGTILVTNAGYPTATTRDRLNALGAGLSLKGKRKGAKTMYQGDEVIENDVWYRLYDGKLSYYDSRLAPIEEAVSSKKSAFSSLAAVMMMGDIFGKSDKEKNDWKARMLKAGLPEGALHMPEDWDSLSEDEKKRRLDGAIDALK